MEPTEFRKTKPVIRSGVVSRTLILLNIFMAAVYFSWWLVPSHVGNPFLYGVLVVGEAYHLFMAFTFWYTVWPRQKFSKNRKEFIYAFEPTVDVFITVTGEPKDVVEATVRAAKQLDYPNHRIYILNDGWAAKKVNWKEAEDVASELSVTCITRENGHGAKAGNINNALSQTHGEIVVIFDADMEVAPDFLQKTIPFFINPKMGFVQVPQYYRNRDLNEVTGSSWEQQEFFFGAIMEGKDSLNSAFLCGTNVAIRRTALMDVHGMREDNVAEDFLTSLAIHQKGWQSRYVKEVLAEGLAPEDLLSYYKQQFRWARGSLEVLLSENLLFKKGLSWAQKIEYLSSALFYTNGLVVLADSLIPIIFLFTGITPVASTTSSFALFFIPFIYLVLYTLNRASNGSLSFRSMALTQSSFLLQVSAFAAALLKEKTKFSVTPKKAQLGNFAYLAYPHIIYTGISALAIFTALVRDGLTPSVAANSAWSVFNVIMFIPFISMALSSEPAAKPELVAPQGSPASIV